MAKVISVIFFLLKSRTIFILLFVLSSILSYPTKFYNKCIVIEVPTQCLAYKYIEQVSTILIVNLHYAVISVALW